MPVLEIHDRIVTHPLAERPRASVRRVVARTADGEQVHVATAPSLESAVALARRVIDDLEAAPGSWAVVGDRLLHPDAIVSVGVVRLS